MIPAREAKVPQSPNIWPALPGAMSAIFATKPACPAEAVAKLMKVSSKNAEGAQQTIHESQHCRMKSFTQRSSAQSYCQAHHSSRAGDVGICQHQ